MDNCLELKVKNNFECSLCRDGFIPLNDGIVCASSAKHEHCANLVAEIVANSVVESSNCRKCIVEPNEKYALVQDYDFVNGIKIYKNNYICQRVL